MGTYIKLNIVNSKRKCIETLCEAKGGLGDEIMLFSKFKCNIEDNIYFFINSITEALANIDKMLVYISQNIKADSFYDEWSLKSIEKIMVNMVDLRDKIEKYKDNKDYFIFADYKEALGVYYDRLHELNPSETISERKKYVKNLLGGLYNNKYPSQKELEFIEGVRSGFIDKIKERNCLSYIDSSGSKYEPKLISIGNYKLLRFVVDFQLDNVTDFIKLNLEEELASINDILKNDGFGYELENFNYAEEKSIMSILFMKVLSNELGEDNNKDKEIKSDETNEKNALVKKLADMGVSDVKGKNPYSMSAEELNVLCDWFDGKRKEIDKATTNIN